MHTQRETHRLGNMQPCPATTGVDRHQLCGSSSRRPCLKKRFLSNSGTIAAGGTSNGGSPPFGQHQHFDSLHFRSRKIASGMARVWLGKRHKAAWVDSQLGRDTGRRTTAPEPAPPQHKLGGSRHLNMEVCRTLCEQGRVPDAVDALSMLLSQRGRRRRVGNNLFYRLLKWCMSHKDLDLGRRVHALAVDRGYEGDAFLATHLMGMYAAHGEMEEAMRVFRSVPAPDAYNWATVIFACAKHGEAVEAIRLYREMRDRTSIVPDNRIYVAVLKACVAAGDLAAGKEVHAHVVAGPGTPDAFVHSSLVDMYAKCGSLADARTVFDALPNKNVVVWTAMISGYAHRGMGKEALGLYSSMMRTVTMNRVQEQECGAAPDSVTYVCLLQACASVGGGAVDELKQLHSHIQARGLQDDVGVGGSLVNAYAKCGDLSRAWQVFDALPARNALALNAILSGYVQQGMGRDALALFARVQQEGGGQTGGSFSPDSVTFVCLLQACANAGAEALDQGKWIHAQVRDRRLQDDLVVSGSLINMYAKCGCLEVARSLFDALPVRDVVTWTAMMAGYVQQGMGAEALCLYSRMQLEDSLSTAPNSVTFVCLLQACACVGVPALQEGRQLHAQIRDRGLLPLERTDMDAAVVLGGSLVNMYAKCGSLEDARDVFDRLPARNVVAWNALLSGYAQQEGMWQEALHLYRRMEQEGLIRPDSVTYVCLLQACASVGAGALDQGRQLEVHVRDRGLGEDVVVGGSLVNMYAKCGSLVDARRVFDSLRSRNVVTWTAMIAGYVQQGEHEAALALYRSMRLEGLIPPNSVTYAALLQACAAVAALSLGKHLHAEMQAHQVTADAVAGAALVNMYAKCGSMADAQRVFDSLPPPPHVEAWSAVIAGYAHQSDTTAVFDMLDRMLNAGVPPDGVTFLAVLTSCSHAGLVDKGRHFFAAMRTHHGIVPGPDHYACLVDMLGRAGHLDDALRMARSVAPGPPAHAVWIALLGACRKWENLEVGRQAFVGAVSADATDGAAYVVMANMCASAGMWGEAQQVMARKRKMGASKKPGHSWCSDMSGVVHTFGVGDRSQAVIGAGRLLSPAG